MFPLRTILVVFKFNDQLGQELQTPTISQKRKKRHIPAPSGTTKEYPTRNRFFPCQSQDCTDFIVKFAFFVMMGIEGLNRSKGCQGFLCNLTR